MAEEQKMVFLAQKGSAGTQAKYYQRKLIGTGSYGEAWLVERGSDQAIYICKSMNLAKMSARDKQYAYSEIKCLAYCNHPNIIRYIEDTEEDNRLMIVMEFADAGDLDRQIKARALDNFRYFQEHEVIFIWIQLLLAMHHVHTHKMLHRDIKSANVMLTTAGLIKLGDFGFSKMYDETISGAVANTFCGTPYYLAPELWNNQRYSKKADSWALGILFYEIVALKRPFVANNMKALCSKIQAGDYPAIPAKFSNELGELIKFILVSDPDKRPSVHDILRHPFTQKGLALLVETVEKNSRIPAPVKEELLASVQEAKATAASIAKEPPSVTPGRTGKINKEVFHQGMVQKLGGPHGSSGWKDRFLVLRDGHLIIYDKEGDEASGKSLNLELVQSVCPVPASAAKADFVFSLNAVGGKSMWLQAKSAADMEKWIGCIQEGLGIM